MAYPTLLCLAVQSMETLIFYGAGYRKFGRSRMQFSYLPFIVVSYVATWFLVNSFSKKNNNNAHKNFINF